MSQWDGVYQPEVSSSPGDPPTGGSALSHEHNFVFLRQRTEETTWHNFETFDVFYCEKCLTYKEVTVTKVEVRRW